MTRTRTRGWQSLKEGTFYTICPLGVTRTWAMRTCPSTARQYGSLEIGESSLERAQITLWLWQWVTCGSCQSILTPIRNLYSPSQIPPASNLKNIFIKDSLNPFIKYSGMLCWIRCYAFVVTSLMCDVDWMPAVKCFRSCVGCQILFVFLSGKWWATVRPSVPRRSGKWGMRPGLHGVLVGVCLLPVQGEPELRCVTSEL